MRKTNITYTWKLSLTDHWDHQRNIQHVYTVYITLYNRYACIHKSFAIGKMWTLARKWDLNYTTNMSNVSFAIDLSLALLFDRNDANNFQFWFKFNLNGDKIGYNADRNGVKLRCWNVIDVHWWRLVMSTQCIYTCNTCPVYSKLCDEYSNKWWSNFILNHWKTFMVLWSERPENLDDKYWV